MSGGQIGALIGFVVLMLFFSSIIVQPVKTLQDDDPKSYERRRKIAHLMRVPAYIVLVGVVGTSVVALVYGFWSWMGTIG